MGEKRGRSGGTHGRRCACAPVVVVPEVADLRGDVLVAQGKVAEARAAYQFALDKTDASSPLRGLAEIKLDALGEAK